MSDQKLGFWLGMIAVTSFGLTLPVTQVALPYFDALFIGFGRAWLAGLVALVLLIVTRSPLPNASQFKQLIVVTLGVVLGFPVLSAIAMQTVPSAHGGVVLGILPLATACVATLITNERPSPWFWIISVIGALVVVAYSLGGSSCIANRECSASEGLSISWGDILLFFAVITAAFGYAVGAVTAKTMPGWRVICWSLVIALPITTIVSLPLRPNDLSAISVSGWSAFIYLSLVSQLLAFFIWYKGLALGGIARVSQTQLFQPIVTLIAAALLAKEHVDSNTLLFAAAVISIVWLARKARISEKPTVTKIN
ncbi:MAG TPA: EamA family transporter [Gammaproteobacteria bacterium]|jgi:drug/metabolite transporter (DMT)-like permease|nr:EamA family transporter [Gammaproteobacteria bacterium]